MMTWILVGKKTSEDTLAIQLTPRHPMASCFLCSTTLNRVASSDGPWRKLLLVSGVTGTLLTNLKAF